MKDLNMILLAGAVALFGYIIYKDNKKNKILGIRDKEDHIKVTKKDIVFETQTEELNKASEEDVGGERKRNVFTVDSTIPPQDINLGVRGSRQRAGLPETKQTEEVVLS